MVIGQNIAAWTHNHARAHIGAAGRCWVLLRVTEEETKQGVIAARVLLGVTGLASLNADHGGQRGLCRSAQATCGAWRFLRDRCARDQGVG